MNSTFAFIIGLLQAALALLGFAQQHPELPQAQRDQAQQVAQQAITQATTALNNNAQPSAPTQSSNGTTAYVSTFATPTSGAAPLTVTFVAPPSAGGDYIYFGDGADGCSVPGVVRGEMGCSVPSGTPITHTYTNPGVYQAGVGRHLPSTTLASATITVTGNGTSQATSVFVSGMQKYTDNNEFGFSFWLPTSWTTNLTTAPNMLNASGYQGGTLKAAWDFSGSVAGRIDEYYSPNSSITILGKPLYYNYDYTLYFDTTAHTWMQTQNGVTNAADVSNNTMGGLHMISVFGETIVSLSAHNFLIIHSEGRDYLDGIIKTIVATDPSVAVSADVLAQTQIVQTEYNNYVTALTRCDNLGEVGALTLQNCRQDAVRGQ